MPSKSKHFPSCRPPEPDRPSSIASPRHHPPPADGCDLSDRRPSHGRTVGGSFAGCSALPGSAYATTKGISTAAFGAIAYCTVFGAAMLKARPALILMAVAQTCIAALAHAESPHMIGSWKVDITFTSGESRTLRFDAQGGGKGSFLLLDPRLKVWGPGKPSEAKWAQGEGNSVTFSGPVEFPLGNVGRDPGTLVFKGKLETETSMTGEVDFSPLIGEQPSKHGTFKAARTGKPIRAGAGRGTPTGSKMERRQKDK